MSVQPVSPPRASGRGKKQDAPQLNPLRKRKSRPAIDYDDDWAPPLAGTMTPARVISEFIDSDYDMM